MQVQRYNNLYKTVLFLANVKLDIILAIDTLPGDFERSSRDIRSFCEALLNSLELGVDDSIVALATSYGYFARFSDVFNNDFFYFFDEFIRYQGQRVYHELVYSTNFMLDHYRYPAPDGTLVPRADAPDVVIVLSEGESTFEASSFIQRIEPRARQDRISLNNNILYITSL